MKEGMKMPGFTADASLYKPRRHYDLMVNQGGDGQVIMAADYNYFPWSCSSYSPDMFGGSAGICLDACLHNPLCSARTCTYACIPGLKDSHDLYFDHWLDID